MFDEAHSFGDVLLEPQKSDISSRSEIDLSVQLAKNMIYPLCLVLWTL